MLLSALPLGEVPLLRCLSRQEDFLAFGIESFGGLGKDAMKVFDLVTGEELQSARRSIACRSGSSRHCYRWTGSGTMQLLLSGADDVSQLELCYMPCVLGLV